MFEDECILNLLQQFVVCSFETTRKCCLLHLCRNCFALNSSIPGSTTGNAYKGLKFNDRRSEPTCEVLDPISTTTQIKLPQRNPIFAHGPSRLERCSYSVGCFLLSPTIFHCNIPAVARFVQVCTYSVWSKNFDKTRPKPAFLCGISFVWHMYSRIRLVLFNTSTAADVILRPQSTN